MMMRTYVVSPTLAVLLADVSGGKSQRLRVKLAGLCHLAAASTYNVNKIKLFLLTP
jgi:hypothetical protein